MKEPEEEINEKISKNGKRYVWNARQSKKRPTEL